MTPAKTELLIVDDLPENLLALEALVRRDDLAVFQARSGEGALELLLGHDFAMAILDVQMPGMTGFELAELMRGPEKTRHIPIVFVSAAGRELDYAFRGYENGAVDFLYKPLDGFAVRSKVAVFVDLFRQRRQLKSQLAALEESRRLQEVLLGELQTTQVELQDALRVRDDFMSMVAHELRTPLSVLSVDLQLRRKQLKKGSVPWSEATRLDELFEKDLRHVRGMNRLIEDMLDVTRMRNGRLSIRPSPTDLSKLLERVVANFSRPDAEHPISLAAPPGVTAEVDEFRIEQVIANLLTNAMRYGAPPIEVTLSTSPGEAQMTVRDHGTGIPPEEHDRIFEQFVRVGDSVSGSGLGLGLFITRQLVAAHGGSIRVESPPGEGAGFVVTLPMTGG